MSPTMMIDYIENDITFVIADTEESAADFINKEFVGGDDDCQAIPEDFWRPNERMLFKADGLPDAEIEAICRAYRERRLWTYIARLPRS